MPVVSRQTHCLREAAVEIRTHLHIGIGDEAFVRIELVGQGQGYRISTSFQHLDKEFAVARNPRAETAVEALQFRNELQETEVVTLIQSHQTDKTARLDEGPWNQL